MERNAITFKNPAEHIIAAMGGTMKAAKLLGKDPTAVSRLKRSKDRKGNGGEIPRSWQKLILEISIKYGFDITANDLIFGRDADD